MSRTFDESYLAVPELNSFDRMSVTVDKTVDNFNVKFYQFGRWEENGITGPSWGARDFLQRFPDVKEVRSNSASEQYLIPVTDLNVELLKVWPKEQRKIDDLAKAVIKKFAIQNVMQENCANVTANFKINGQLPANHGIDLHKTYPLRPHQIVATYNALSVPGYALFMEQGTGKTPVGISIICNAAKNRRDKSKKFAAIVVVPKAVRVNWANEFRHFATTCGKVTIIKGNEVERIKCFAEAFNTPKQAEFTVVICNYETLQRSWVALQMINWSLALLDESHFIKSIATKRYKYAMKLRDRSAKRIILTGTPITNTLMDLYAQFEFLGKGMSGFGSFAAFKRFYGKFDSTGGGYTKLVGVQNLPFMKDRLARCSFMVKREEVLKDLPPKLYSSTEVNMTKKQVKCYSDMLVNLQAQFETMDMDSAMTVNHMLTQLLRLNQITSGYLKLDDDKETRQDPETGDWVEVVVKKGPVVQIDKVNPKVEALVKIVKELGPKEKLIAWTCFTEDIRAIQERLQAEGIHCVRYKGGLTEKEIENAKYEYNNNPECKVLIGNSRAGGTGLNLLGYDPKSADPIDCNTTKEVFFSQNFSAVDRMQAEDRACRDGQRMPVEIINLVVPGSIDQEIRERVDAKKEHAMDVSDIQELLTGLASAILETNGNNEV